MGSSLVEDVHGELREEILLGRLQPGERLLVQPLAQRFGVSLSVIREALTRLAEQGLAKATPQVGYNVTPLAVTDLVDLTQVRVEIENLMIRRAVVEGDLAWETAVVAAHHSLAGTPRLDPATGHPSAVWRTKHAEFHAAVASGCPSLLLQRFRAELFDKADLYRAWARRASSDRDVAGEHRRICEAVVDRDADAACELMAEHVRRTTDRLLAWMSEARPASA